MGKHPHPPHPNPAAAAAAMAAAKARQKNSPKIENNRKSLGSGSRAQIQQWLLLPGAIAAATLLALLCAWSWSYMHFPAFSRRGAPPAPRVNKTSSTQDGTVKPKTALQKLPTFDELYSLSVENNWTPHDPLEKLQLAIQRFATIQDASPTIVTQTAASMASLSDAQELANALSTEIIFVLEVMKQDTSREFELTAMLFEAIRTVHLSLYSSMKARLRDRREKHRALETGQAVLRDIVLVTKTATELLSASGFLYNSAQELLKLAPMRDMDVPDGASPDTPLLPYKNFTRPFAHITVDLSKAGGAYNLPILATAVMYRLYRLVPVLMGIGASTDRALHMAIVNGDDAAVAVLLAAGGDDLCSTIDAVPAAASSSEDIFSLSPLSLATSLEHSAIVSRLHAAKEQWAHKVAGLQTFSSPSLMVPREAEGSKKEVVGGPGYNSYAQTVSTTAAPAASKSPAGVTGGYKDTGIVPTGLLGSPSPTPVCLVDRHAASSLSGKTFKLQYADRSRPVLIAGDALMAMLQETWTVKNLSSRVGPNGRPSMLELSSIPYGGTLFGLTHVSVSAREYLDPEAIEAGAKAGKPGVTKTLYSGVSGAGVSIKSSTLALERVLRELESNQTQSRSTEAAGAEKGKEWNLFGWIGGTDKQQVGEAEEKPPVILDISDPALVRQLLQGGTIPPPYYFGPGDAIVDNERNLLLPKDKTQASTDGAYLRSLLGVLQDKGSEPNFQFYLGSALTGAPFHSHQWALNGLVHGRKAWLLLPPGRDVYSTLHPLAFSSSGGIRREDWPYKGDDESQGPCVLEQRAGEVLFVPRHWSHSVLNLAEVVGWAIEGAQ